MAEGGE
jgi:hypothetical protein